MPNREFPTSTQSSTSLHRENRAERRDLVCIVLAFLLGAWLAFASSLAAQGMGGIVPGRSIPSDGYFLALAMYRTGDLADATRGFERALSQCRRDPQGRWIDAIPVHAMLAECYYEAGSIGLAHEHLDAALQIHSRFATWPSSVQWPEPQNVAARQAVNRAPWWTGPPLQLGYAPRSIPFVFVNTGVGIAPDGQAGISAESSAQAIDAFEILRGLAIAYYRRETLLGPLAAKEPLLQQSIAAIGPPLPASIPAAVNGIASVRAIAELTNGGDAKVAQSATAFALGPGNSVHPLTPVLLCSIARSLARTNDFQNAYPVAMQAAAAAAILEQPEWVAEAMTLAVGVKPQASAREFFQATSTAMQTTGRDWRLATARLGPVVMEAALDAGLTTEATVATQNAGSLLGSRNVQLPRTNAYYQYVIARLNAAAGELTACDAAIQVLTQFTTRPARNESVASLYQLRLIESASRSAAIGGKTSEALLRHYLSDASAALWRISPVEALGVMAGDRSIATASWILSAANRQAAEEILIRGDLQSVRMFTRALPLDGRVLQARWLAAAPQEALNAEARDFRKAAPPALQRLRQLVQAPLADDPQAVLKQSNAAEVAAYTLALQRLRLPSPFPHQIADKEALQQLQPGEAILAFVPAGDGLLGVLAKQQQVTAWPIAKTRLLPQQIGNLMKELGVVRKRGGVSQAPSDPRIWQNLTLEIRQRLLPDIAALEGIERLVIVPTSALWYLPFDLLPLDDQAEVLLGENREIVYAPTAGLAMQGLRPADQPRPTAFLASMFFAPRDSERNEELAQAIDAVIEDALLLPGKPPVPGRLLGVAAQDVIVASALTPATLPSPFLWSPLGYDSGVSGGMLVDWMRFPFKAPRSIALVGLRTAAAQTTVGGGEELFLNLMALHSAGVSNVILSRWPVGGESTALLLREYAQEVVFEGPEKAWRRSINLLKQTEIDPQGEPLLSVGDADRDDLTGAEPLFWAGYLFSGSLKPTPLPAQ